MKFNGQRRALHLMIDKIHRALLMLFLIYSDSKGKVRVLNYTDSEPGIFSYSSINMKKNIFFLLFKGQGQNIQINKVKKLFLIKFLQVFLNT